MKVKSSSIKVKNLTKKFGEYLALENINLEVREGEFFALLGPSGCGKTTTMRCIAGFENPTSGEIFIGDELVNDKPANKRDCGMVFQSYALFPNYNVFENIAYSLNIKELRKKSILNKVKTLGRLINNRLSKTPKEIEDKVNQLLDYVELTPYANNLISELSGGQQQRVALARVLAMEPSVLLMDEPLSNLDKKLRGTMRDMIRKIQLELGITTIFVTHDQEEAMSMADRIAVMKNGHIQQVGTPTELYSRPASPFIADFLGDSNIYKGENIEQKNGYATIQLKELKIIAKTSKQQRNVNIVIRPENIELNPENKDSENVFEGKVILSTYFGSFVRYSIQIRGYEFIADEMYKAGKEIKQPGDLIRLKIDPERVFVL
ncbi:MAG TPA: ABC transporter ATP-binding protein [Bacillota bacterium]|nr:ABC transporter ATP-binding protein [Bacillota bacterium]